MKEILLGLIQGLTEFLPVSSSGHLVVLQDFLRFSGDRIFFDVMLHFATTLSVLAYFRKEILNYLRKPRMLLFVAVATFFTGLVGLFLKPVVERLAYGPRMVFFFFLITALVLLISDFLEGKKRLEETGWRVPVVFGIFQGISVIPGISRSGLTVFSLLLLGVERKDAAAFSFIAAVPAVLGATFLEMIEASVSFRASYMPAMAAAFVSGLLALRLFVGLFEKRKFKIFSLYLVLFVLILGKLEHLL